MYSRRRLLGAVAGAAVLGGCAEQEEEAEGGSDFPQLSSGSGSFTRWVPDGPDGGERSVHYNVERLRARSSLVGAELYESIAARSAMHDYVGLSTSEITGVHAFRKAGIDVVEGAIADAPVRDALAAGGYEEAEQLETLTVFRHPQADRYSPIAVSDVGILFGYGSPDPDVYDDFVDAATTLVETRIGERPSAADTSEAAANYHDAVGWPLLATDLRKGWSLLSIENQDEVFAGGTISVTDAGADVRRIWVWEREPEIVDRSTLRDAVSDGHVGLAFRRGTFQSVETRRDGRVLEVATTGVPSQRGEGVAPPHATIRGRRDDGTVVVEHRAGATVPTGRLTLASGGDETPFPEGQSFQPGDSITLTAPETGGTIYVQYQPHHDDSPLVLEELPENA